ncbi:BEN domain-containing protein 5 isoform X2 [Ambystoma mexicanum]|uniref:BEN domain-containing protein 5 isoform X2 n=1 Tax=Ambystoma mexicanum TaxID=8296 RepID=UPI0037E8FD51
MYAFVRFLEDNVCYSLPVSCVQNFLPRSRSDFDNQRVYDVYRGPDVGEGRETRTGPGLQRAQILALGNDKADLENRVMQRNIKIPRLSALDAMDDSANHYEEEDMELCHSKKLDGKKMTESTHKSIEAVVARLEKQNGMIQSHHFNSEEDYMTSSDIIKIDCLDTAVIPRALYEELLRNYRQQQEEMRRIQQELERTRRQLVQQAKKLKEYGCLVSEVKELRDLNRRLQDMLLQKLGSGSTTDQISQEMYLQEDGDNTLKDRVNTYRRYRTKGDVPTQHVFWRHSSSPTATTSDSSDGPVLDLEKIKSEPLEPEPELPTAFSEAANTSSYYPAPVPAPVMDTYTIENGKVHLGSGFWVDEEKWHQLQITQGDSKFTKNLAVMIWGTEVLKNRSVTGVATKKKKDAIPKPPLSPHKLSIVRECLYDRIAQETADETEIAQRLSKVNKYICEKIMDINKSCKNEERREARSHVQ